MARTFLALFALILSFAGLAADRTYAVMSVMGDGMLVVRRAPTTGSSLVHNSRQFIALADPVLDRTALFAIDDALRKADPGAKPILLQGGEAAVLDAQQRALGASNATQAIVDALRARLPAVPATHLILVSKMRAGARLKLDDGYVGDGTIEGAGFYIDPTMPLRSMDGAPRGEGFLAPFAYLSVALVEMKTGRVVAEERVRASSSVSQGKSDTLDPWDALTPPDKVRLLQQLIREVGDAVPKLIATP